MNGLASHPENWSPWALAVDFMSDLQRLYRTAFSSLFFSLPIISLSFPFSSITNLHDKCENEVLIKKLRLPCGIKYSRLDTFLKSIAVNIFLLKA